MSLRAAFHAFASGCFKLAAEAGRHADRAGFKQGLPLYLHACRAMLRSGQKAREARFARWARDSGYPSPGWGAQLGSPRADPFLVLHDPGCPWADPRCRGDLLELTLALSALCAGVGHGAFAAGSVLLRIPAGDPSLRAAFVDSMDALDPGWAGRDDGSLRALSGTASSIVVDAIDAAGSARSESMARAERVLLDPGPASPTETAKPARRRL